MEGSFPGSPTKVGPRFEPTIAALIPLRYSVNRRTSAGKFIAGHGSATTTARPHRGARWIFDHPEFILIDLPPGPLSKPGNTLDFSFREVRDFHFGAIEEIARRFDVDGIEITFRSDNHFPYPRSISR